MHKTQLTALPHTRPPIEACRAILRDAHVAVVRHVPVESGSHQVAAFVLDAGLPDGTRLYTGGQLRVLDEGGADPTAQAVYDPLTHSYRPVGAQAHAMPRWGIVTAEGLLTEVPGAPIKVTDADLVKIYAGLKSEDILRGVEPGSHGDAILAAFGRAVLQAYGVPLSEDRA